MEASSIHDQSGMSLEEEEEMRSMALFREELIAGKIKRRQRAAEAAGRKYTWGDGSTGYDWLLIPPSKLEHCFMKVPGEGSHCVASDPTPTKATTARKEAIGVEEKDCNLCND